MQFSMTAIKLALVAAFFLHSATAANPPGEETHCEGFSGPETDVNRCRTQSGPQCTFTFTCTQPPNTDEIEGGLEIFNNACTCINTYDEYSFATTGDKSEFPFDIQTADLDPGLNYNVTVLYTDCSAPPRVQWSYNGASYDESDCDCEDDSVDLAGVTACRCPFPC